MKYGLCTKRWLPKMKENILLFWKRKYLEMDERDEEREHFSHVYFEKKGGDTNKEGVTKSKLQPKNDGWHYQKKFKNRI